MAKTLVDIPEDKLARAQARLGTATKRETVERALDWFCGKPSSEI